MSSWIRLLCGIWPARIAPGLACGLYFFLGSLGALAGNGALEIRNGYFWDPVAGSYFIPRGIAYQSWNPPVGANQSFAQLDYDLLEFKKMHANSVRCEITWGEVELKDNQYDWRKPDHLIQKAEELGLRLFILIGYQYPPAWFPKDWRNVNDQYTTSNIPAFAGTNGLSDVINYEHPEAREKYREHLAAVAGRYKNSRAVGAWIVGNEYAYFDLWEDPSFYEVHRFIGYDPISQSSFRAFLKDGYGGDIAALNFNWGTSHANFDEIVMPRIYPHDRRGPAFHDLIQWRKKSIGDYVALGSLAARQADPNHLQTYSMVGGIFNGRDANHTCEDARAIVARCKAAGAPLDFWSINNYANASLGEELRSADFGVAKYQAESGLPVMISETGHSSTETLYDFPDAGRRQNLALPGQVWESLISGAIGTHIFHWSDRRQFTPDYFMRERGFGITDEDRTPKQPVYDNVAAMFLKMQDIRVDNLLGGSLNPPPDMLAFWSTNSDMVWPRANQEIAKIWGAIKRIGYQPHLLDDEGFENRRFTNAPILLLSRTYQLAPHQLDALETNVLAAGIHIHADADIPGQFNPYHHPNPSWKQRMWSLFGLNVSNAVTGLDAIVTNDTYKYIGLTNTGPLRLGLVLRPGYNSRFKTWKIWHGVRADASSTVLYHRGNEGEGIPDSQKQPLTPALVIKTHRTGYGRSAINTFAISDSFLDASTPQNVIPRTPLWDMRFDVLRAVYLDHFGVRPILELTGPGAKYVIPDYRICHDGGILLSLLNEHTNRATVTVRSASLLNNKVVENLTGGGILSSNATGTIVVPLVGDDYVLLYVYPRADGVDGSLVNPAPDKLWFHKAPVAVWGDERGVQIQLGRDTVSPDLELALELVETRGKGRVLARPALARLQPGSDRQTFQLDIPDADLLSGFGVDSSKDGGEFVWRACLLQQGRVLASTEVPVRMLWAVRPLALPEVKPGSRVRVPIEWEELPSQLNSVRTPLDRAELWSSLQAGREFYRLNLTLLSQGVPVASGAVLAGSGSGTQEIAIDVPLGALGPYEWRAEAAWTTNTSSQSVADGFEGRERGALTKQWEDDTNAVSLLFPWKSYHYPQGGAQQWWDEGVQLEGSQGSQSAFLIITNPVPPLGFSGFGMIYTFPARWALPADRTLWKNYRFSFDFKVKGDLACVIEVQIKNPDDADGGQRLIRLQKPYTPDPVRGGWDTVGSTLDEFETPFFSREFDPSRVVSLVVNVQMVQADVGYFGAFDNIRFEAPRELTGLAQSFASYTSGNDIASAGPRIWIEQDRGLDVRVHWLNGKLESASDPAGPWKLESNSAAASPHRPDFVEPQKYFRVRP